MSNQQGKLFRVADKRAKPPKRQPGQIRPLRTREPNPIVAVPTWDDNGQPIRGRRYQVLQRTDTRYVLYDRDADLSVSHPTFSTLPEAIEAFLSVDQRTWE